MIRRVIRFLHRRDLRELAVWLLDVARRFDEEKSQASLTVWGATFRFETYRDAAGELAVREIAA